MTDKSNRRFLPPPITAPCRRDDLDGMLEKEWLLTNKIGAYASSTIVGCNSRRYHGLLVAAVSPPVGREAALSTLLEQLTVNGELFELSTNEFAGAFSPRGFEHLAEYRDDVAPTFVYRVGSGEVVKEIVLAESANAVAVRYTVRGFGPGKVTLKLWPFAAMRDFHSLRKVEQPHQMTFEHVRGGVAVQDRMRKGHALHIVSHEASFQTKPQWWYRFLYRADIARGQDGLEDLYTPGAFVYELADGQSCQITASLKDALPLGFSTTLSRRQARLESLCAAMGDDADEFTRRLAAAADAFVVQRSFANAAPAATILAGYHWFADWGRDAFIALPGLLLATKRFDLARGVFRTFASHMSGGMVPNRFDDYLPAAHYNSIDASLWFIIAAGRYVEATGDTAFWRDTLLPAAAATLEAYQAGTMFDIRADADSLLAGGTRQTQLTWMDAKLGDEVVTPRHGKAVEVNALWHAANRIVAANCRQFETSLGARCDERADLIGPAFVRAFWNRQENCLYDCVTDGAPDAAVRPNQILAVSLPYSPLSRDQQAGVVAAVKRRLLTPYGLRTLSPTDSRYRRGYGGSWESRDRASHQGTVWAWLIGPFIEAYLKVEDYKPLAVEQARQWLAAFETHLSQAGLGYVSEIFDGDAPHAPRGCIAQAWSVAEILRCKVMLAKLK